MSETDQHWLQTTVNDLNNLLQVISESSKALEPICETSPEGMRYFAFLRNSLGRATQVTAQLAGKLGGQTSPPVESLKQEPTAGARRPPAAIDNPNGAKELI